MHFCCFWRLNLTKRRAIRDNIIENPGLSYGFFHATAQPVLFWGVVRQVKLPGVNIDMPHQSLLTVSKSGDAQAWIAYNRLRGQYVSALEHAVPERFFSDTSQCNLVGDSNPKPGLPNCPQGISAVKAISLAAQAGQKIYTITPELYQRKPGIVGSQLGAHSTSTQQRVQQALDAGYEVTIHERPVTQDGWTGAGFTVIDGQTGGGGYLIEGGGNGGASPAVDALILGLGVAAASLPLVLMVAYISFFLLALIAALTWYFVFCYIDGSDLPMKGDLANISWGFLSLAVGGLVGTSLVISAAAGLVLSGLQNHACF